MVTFLAGDGEAGGIDQPFVLYPIVRVPRGSLSVLYEYEKGPAPDGTGPFSCV
jgi:hypothetical protein